MNHLRVVFGIIKEHCDVAGVSDKECFTALEQQGIGRQVFFTLYLYIEVLQGLGLITFSNYTKGITITEKGKAAPIDSIVGLHSSFLLLLYFLRRVFLFVLFWPMFLIIPGVEDTEKKNSAG